MVLEVAHQFKSQQKFDAIFWVQAERKDLIRESFSKIAQVLGLEGAIDSSDDDCNFMLVQQWLGETGMFTSRVGIDLQIRLARSWLLIYDNVDDFSLLKNYYPLENTKGFVIVTTRFLFRSIHILGRTILVGIKKFDPVTSLQLFNIRKTHDAKCDAGGEVGDTQDVLGALDGLALGIKQIAHYIGQNSLRISAFQEEYSMTPHSILEHDMSGSTATESIASLWSSQFETAEDTNMNAFKLLAMLSLAHADNIPLELFQLGELKKEDSTSTTDEYDPRPSLETRSEIDWVSFCRSPVK